MLHFQLFTVFFKSCQRGMCILLHRVLLREIIKRLSCVFRRMAVACMVSLRMCMFCMAVFRMCVFCMAVFRMRAFCMWTLCVAADIFQLLRISRLCFLRCFHCSLCRLFHFRLFLRFTQSGCRFCPSGHPHACRTGCRCTNRCRFLFRRLFFLCGTVQLRSGTNQVCQEKINACVAFICLFHCCLADDPLQRARTVRVILADIRQLVIDMHQCNADGIVALKRQYACNHFKHRDTQRIDIAFFIHIAASCLLRGEIMHRACRICRCCHGGCGCRSGNTKIRHLYHAVCPYQNILGLDISMYDVRLMRLTQRRGNLNCHIDSRTGIKGCFFLDCLLQCIPVDVFINDIINISVLAHIIRSYDIRMG